MVTAIWGRSQTIVIVSVVSFPCCPSQHCCHVSHVTVTEMPDSSLHFANLNELNYAEWSLYMRSTLIKKGLWKVVEGSETCPLRLLNSKAVKAFECCRAEAHAEIILCLKPSQLPHAHSADPYVLWEELQRMHRAQGFATRMTLRRRFNMMTKRADQSMSSWTTDVQQAAFHLKEVRYTAMDEDKILVLTQGLPLSYDPFIISLDAPIAANTSPNDSDLSIPIEVVKAHLIHEESHQHAAQSVTTPDVALAVTTAAPKTRRPLEQITCFHCGEKGHYQINC